MTEPAGQIELIVISGPTAVGKTDVAVQLAKELQTEIISADSMQVYRHLSIGTAKPRTEELRSVPYHMVDYVEPSEQYHLGRFLDDAAPIISRLKTQGKLPIICGGTGMYIQGLLYGVFDQGRDEAIRKELDNRAEKEGLEKLYQEMRATDPYSAHIMPNDRKRIVRALEVYYATGLPLSSLQVHKNGGARVPSRLFVLTMEREALYRRINERVHRMLEMGLLDEIKAYLDNGYSVSNPAIFALGYSELIRHVNGEITLPAATEIMKQKSRNYAKRQLTWFRHMKEAEYVDTTGKQPHELCDIIKNSLANLGACF